MQKPYILIKEDMKKDISDAINNYIGKVYISDIRDYLLKIASNMQEAADVELKNIQEQYEKATKEEAGAESQASGE